MARKRTLLFTFYVLDKFVTDVEIKWWWSAQIVDLFRIVFCLLLPYLPLDNIRVMVIAWRLGGNIIRTALCWVVWHNVHSQQHTHMSSSYRSSRLGLSHWDPCTMYRGGCLELYYRNMVKSGSGGIEALSARPTGFLQCFDTVGLVVWPVKIVPDMTYNVFGGTLNLAQSVNQFCLLSVSVMMAVCLWKHLTVPRVLFDSWSAEDFNTLFSSEQEQDACSRTLIQFLQVCVGYYVGFYHTVLCKHCVCYGSSVCPFVTLVHYLKMAKNVISIYLTSVTTVLTQVIDHTSCSNETIVGMWVTSRVACGIIHVVVSRR